MSDDARILQLLEEVLNSGRTPDDVCANSPELPPAVRARWEVCRRLNAQFDDFFRPETAPPRSVISAWRTGPAATTGTHSC